MQHQHQEDNMSSPSANANVNSSTTLEQGMTNAAITATATATTATATESGTNFSSKTEEDLNFTENDMDIDNQEEEEEEDTESVETEEDEPDNNNTNKKNKNKNSTTTDKDPIILLTEALTFKEKGNEQFKNKEYTKASRSYKKGINQIKHLHSPPSNTNTNTNNDEQITSLLISLQSNLCMVYYKLENFIKTKEVADNILKNLDKQNSKALYRRGLSNYKLNRVLDAKQDLYQALQLSPKDKSIVKEYRIVKKEYDVKMQKHQKDKEKQKKALARAFSSSGGNGSTGGDSSSILYNDKEEELKRKQQEKKEKELEAQKMKEKRKVDWEDECVKRMSNNEDAVTFEEYEKEIKDKEEEEEKARKKAKKHKEEQDRRTREAQRKERRKLEEEGGDDDDDDDDILTETELRSLRGYKKTSDGRTTSYFTREQTDEEKKLLGSIAPKKLEPVPVTTTNYNADESNLSMKTKASPRHTDSSISSSSAWNQAGTWEEKDTSEWCNQALERFLKDSKVSVCLGDTEDSTSSVDACVTKVKDLEGDASVAFVSGKKRFVFDYSTELSFEISCRVNNGMDTEGDNNMKNLVIAKGSIGLPDISSASISDEDIEVQIMKWKKAPKDQYEQQATECRNKLVDKVREQVHNFVLEFNSQY